MAKKHKHKDSHVPGAHKILVSTWNHIIGRTEYVFATEEVKCPACNYCLRVEGATHCIYGLAVPRS